ncbi:MAG: hypothetical protein PHR36_00810 [Patescibacteria group bacterium]|nr:hypothetical protein [Patescibacteria group bacterium]
MAHKTFLKKFIFIILAVLISPFLVNVVQAAGDPTTSSIGPLLEVAGNAAKYETGKVESNDISIPSIAGGIIKIFLSILGVIFVALMLYGGYLWMTARGNQEMVTKSKELMTSAVIGLIIVIAAYAITYFVLYMMAREYIQPEVTGF